MADVWSLPRVECECCGGSEAEATQVRNALQVFCLSCGAIYETNAVSFVIKPIKISAEVTAKTMEDLSRLIGATPCGARA